MAEYQNIFTRVQVRSAPHMGVAIDAGPWTRGKDTWFSYWLGKFGDAQIGPFYLGFTGLASIVCGIIAIEIIGLNMWASVNRCSSCGSCPGSRSSRQARSTASASRRSTKAAGG